MKRVVTVVVAMIAIAPLTIARQSSSVDAYGYGSGAAYGLMAWETLEGEVTEQGLFLIENAAAGNIRRLLICPVAESWRAIATYTLNPAAGMTSLELRDDRTGWWIRADQFFGVQGDTVGEFFARADEELSQDDPRDYSELRLSTRDGFERLARAPASELDSWASFLTTMDAGELEELAKTVPPGFREAVWFLNESLMNWISAAPSGIASQPRSEMTDLFGVLASALDSQYSEAHERSHGNHSRVMRVGESYKGRGVVEPEVLELTARFRSVDNADPLARHHVEEVTGHDAIPPGQQ